MFSTDFVKQNDYVARVVLGCVLVVALLLILILGSSVWRTNSNACAGTVGCPPSYVFAIVWTLIVLALAFAFIVVIFNYTLTGLIGFFCSILVFCIACYGWLYAYNAKGDKTGGAYSIGAANLASLVALVFALASDAPSAPKTTVGAIVALPVSWTLYALLLNRG